MKKLFMITIGGKTEKSNIEVHDVRFLVASKIEDTYDSLKSSWFGTEKSLHIDRYKIIEQVAGYDITISDESSDTRLFMINLGGTEVTSYLEWHTILLLACKSKSEAIDLATSQYKHIKDLHLDNIIDVNDVLQGKGQLKLVANDIENKNSEIIGYKKIR